MTDTLSQAMELLRAVRGFGLCSIGPTRIEADIT